MKKVYQNTNLTCIFQNEEISADQSITGDIFMTEDGMRFEEEVKEPKKHTRNPKIFNGTFVSLVRKSDKTVKFSFKDVEPDFDHEKFVKNVTKELKAAIKKLD